MPEIPVSFESASGFCPFKVLLFLNLTIASIAQLHLVSGDQVLEEIGTHIVAVRALVGLHHLRLSHQSPHPSEISNGESVNQSAPNFPEMDFVSVHSR